MTDSNEKNGDCKLVIDENWILGIGVIGKMLLVRGDALVFNHASQEKFFSLAYLFRVMMSDFL